MTHIEQGMRQSIAEFLPRALTDALTYYKYFQEQQITDPNSYPTSKTFKDHYDACKAALAHIETLIKLAQWADIPDPLVKDENEHQILLGLIEQAKVELHG